MDKKCIVSIALIAVLLLNSFVFADKLSIENEGGSSNQKEIQYLSFTGEVKKIEKRGENLVLWTGDEEEKPANLLISKDTFIVNDEEIEIGSRVIGFYDIRKPMILPYPPQYNIEVFAVLDDGISVKFDSFDENLTSSDNMLKLNISEETEIFLQDGGVFTGELANRNLIVFYGPSTKSIPAQTVPYSVVVMFEKAVPPIYVFPDVSGMDIIVEDKKIESPSGYNKDNGAVMLAIRPICESMGMSVLWHNKTQSVTINENLYLKTGDNDYTRADGEKVKLDIAPEIKDSRLYVPLDFFREVLDMNNAYVFEGQILIDNGELME